MTATSIRLRRHKGYKNFGNSEAHNAVNAEAGSVDQEEPPVEPLETEEERQVREAEEKRIAGEAAAADAALEKPSRGASKEAWTTYVGALHTKPEGYSEDLTRDQIADLVLGPKS